MATEEHARRQSNEIDADGDGFITASELKSHLQENPAVSDANAAQTFAFADADNDQEISYDEFRDFIRQGFPGVARAAGLPAPRPPARCSAAAPPSGAKHG
ncbi:Ca2+-binding EF-hand superfamily protein [Kitasatospora gansuensis]|uniref:Ca2+-binding EF-hand superfamily protein n=1 Tax=Kitasatospora gansuensis TaxID=258050 RepID=A0A7W7WJC2_9ACTN|nr:EF-hand domain-containing protein [Kitasatospora gansuensis]MBB4948449.1 Ca2+-binding EF-hand superfamily protein [Kitasatospora gansuensis]